MNRCPSRSCRRATCALLFPLLAAAARPIVAAEPAVPTVTLNSVWDAAGDVSDLMPDPKAVATRANQLAARFPARLRIATWLASVAVRDQLPATDSTFRRLIDSAKLDGNTFTAADPQSGYYAFGNAHTAVLIATRDTLRVVSLADLANDIDWISNGRSATSLVQFSLRSSPSGTVNVDRVKVSDARLEREGNAVRFIARSTPADASKAAPCEAAVTLTLEDASPLVRFDLAINAMPAGAAPTTIKFPVLGGAGYASRTDAIAGTLGLSRLIRGVDKPIDDHLWAEQFRVLTLGKSSLYVAAYDPDHEQKYYHFEAGKELHLRAAGTDPSALGKPWAQAYPIYVGPFTGDWFDAAQRYREWGLKQKWAKRGPVKDWTGPNKKMAQVMLWPQTLGPAGPNTDKAAKMLRTIASDTKARTGAHYYQWWGAGSDAFAPRMLHGDMRPGLPEAWKQLESEGIDIMPYFNVLYWRTNPPKGSPKVEPDTAGAVAAACMPLAGADGDDSAGEQFANKGDRYLVNAATLGMMPLCRLTDFWQKFNVDIAKIIVDSGCDLAYLDQGGVPPRSPCYNPAHGHTPGGSKQWAEGTHELCRRIKFEGGKEIALSSEGAYEGYMDVVENHFMHYWTWLAPRDVLCPLFEATYHDYSLFMSAVKTRQDPVAYAIDTGTRLLYGNQFRFDFNLINDPAQKQQVQFVERMARLRAVGAKYLVEGRLIRPVAVAEAPPTVTCDWMEKADKATKEISITQKMTYPQLERGAFAAADGSEATFVVNFGKTDGELKLTPPNGKRKAVVTGNDGKTKTIDVSATAAIAVPAFDGVMVQFQ